MKNKLPLLAAFIGGAVAGVMLGILFAPDSGEETRKKIADFLSRKEGSAPKPENDVPLSEG